MNLTVINTVSEYQELFSINNQREDYFRYTMMKPLEEMWTLIGAPLKSKEKNGYDVLMASKMLGFLDINDTQKGIDALNKIKKNNLLSVSKNTLEKCKEFLISHDLKINCEELLLGLYIADPIKLNLQNGYCGFGGIPGYIQLAISPNSYNIPRFPSLIAHEFHHNIRFSYFNWDHGNVSVGDYIVIEGMAESFAQELFGKKNLGPWVTSFSKEDLDYSTEVIKDAAEVKGFAEVSSYMYGDIISKEQGFLPVGLSPFAGYAVGYHLVQKFMKENNASISEVTLLDTKSILNAVL